MTEINISMLAAARIQANHSKAPKFKKQDVEQKHRGSDADSGRVPDDVDGYKCLPLLITVAVRANKRAIRGTYLGRKPSIGQSKVGYVLAPAMREFLHIV